MSKRLWVLAALVTLLIAMGCGVGQATMPSLAGPTGVVWTPNALVAPVGQVQLMLDYARMQTLSFDTYEVAFDRREDTNLWKFEALGGIANGAELWAAYSTTRNNDSDEDSGIFRERKIHAWSVGAKYQFQEGCAPKNWLFALGADYRKGTGDFPTIFSFEEGEGFDLTDKFETDRKAWDVYAVATADLGAMGNYNCNGGRFLGSVGVMWRKIDWTITDNFADLSNGTFGSESFTVDDRSTVRPFIGLEYFSPDRTSFGVEYLFKGNRNDEDTDFIFGDNIGRFRERAVWGAVLRHEFVGGFTAQVGITDADDIGFGERQSNWFVGVGYNFGCK